ncbi:hypothetical protein LSCM4_05207 [Leishmania orientalis]|uniref:Uncharacterized protein n=1 Tax=Leishmania orientalis TaxID=2249476 RepID=A0A836KS49_9TRYP|nr:hypothetical protein LSCM4_05207 [Leishmania orientalis]
MRELSNRQWRALAQAYPFYLADGAGAQGTADDRARDRQAGLAQSGLAAPSLSLKEEFVQCVVPRVAKAFPEELQAYGKGGGCVEQERANGSELVPSAPRSTTEAVDALLAYLFGCATSALSKLSPTKRHRAFTSTCFAPHIAPLSRREQQLLGLYHRKQEQYAYVLRVQQQLLAASQLAVQTLQGVSNSILPDALRDGSAPQQGAGEGLASSARERFIFPAEQEVSSWPPPPAPAAATDDGTSACSAQAALAARAPTASSTNGCDASSAFRSALANFPCEIHSLETSAAAAPPVAGTGTDSPFHRLSTYTAPPLIATNRCAGCHEVGGDLLLCTQCGEVRHEACGGPHPLERSKADGRMPTVNICKRCAKELNLSSDSSSLRSSTSSSERAELDEYFGSDDDDSSLSGFIVHTSDDDEAEDDGSSDVSSANGEEGDGRRRGMQRSKGAPPPRKGQGGTKGRRRGSAATATAAASEVMLGSSSHVWSRSASLGRALAVAAERKHEKRGFDKKAHTVSDDDAGASAPRYDGLEGCRRKRRRGGSEDEESGRSRYMRKRSGGDASDASSLLRSAPSTPSALSTKKARPLHAEKKLPPRHQTSTEVPPSLQRQEQARRAPALTGKESTAHSPLDHRRADPLPAQPRRAMLLEQEEELGALGIALSSASGSPKVSSSSSSKQRQDGIANRSAGRKGVMNIASSSSSSDDSD